MDFNTKITKLQSIIDSSSRIVFFGGAGVSTESGIPDFRSSNGIYSEKNQYPPEQILSHTFFMNHTDLFYKFYRDKMIYKDAVPGTAHKKLAQWENEQKLTSIVTQNIDGLHQKAGNKKVIELHGSVERNYCMNCNTFYGLDTIIETKGIPKCSCGGIIKPDVVLYEEALDEHAIDQAIQDISNADTLIIAGTSLSVYPAASFINYFRGKHLVVINKSNIPIQNSDALIFHEGIGEVFKELK